jgi:hypothetical protein
MFNSSIFKRFVSLSLVTSMLLISLQSVFVSAAMVSTESKIAIVQQDYERQQVLEIVRTADAKQTLLNLGVAPADVEARIANMTTAELAQLNQQIKDLPAGGNAIIGAIVFVLVLLVVLDLLGATDVFPVIRPIGSHR